jgi:hypothetical protein
MFQREPALIIGVVQALGAAAAVVANIRGPVTAQDVAAAFVAFAGVFALAFGVRARVSPAALPAPRQ